MSCHKPGLWCQSWHPTNKSSDTHHDVVVAKCDSSVLGHVSREEGGIGVRWPPPQCNNQVVGIHGLANAWKVQGTVVDSYIVWMILVNDSFAHDCGIDRDLELVDKRSGCISSVQAREVIDEDDWTFGLVEFGLDGFDSSLLIVLVGWEREIYLGVQTVRWHLFRTEVEWEEDVDGLPANHALSEDPVDFSGSLFWIPQFGGSASQRLGDFVVELMIRLKPN